MNLNVPVNQDLLVNLAQTFLSKQDLLTSALEVTRSRRNVYDKEYSIENLGISVGVKFEDPDKPSNGLNADIEIKDLTKLISNTEIGFVKLRVTFRKKNFSANHLFDLMVEYELHHTHEEFGSIALIISQNNNQISSRFSVLSTKHYGRRFIQPFEIKLNSTDNNQIEGIISYSHYQGEEFPINIRKDDDTFQLLIKSPEKITLFEFSFNRKKSDLQIKLDFSILGYEYFSDLNIENSEEEVRAYGLFRVLGDQANFKIEIDKLLQNINLRVALFGKPLKIFKFLFREIPHLLLKEYETSAYEVLVYYHPKTPPASLRLGFNNQTLSGARIRNEIEILISFPNGHRQAMYLPIKLQRDSFVPGDNNGHLLGHASESLRAFAEFEGIKLFESHSELTGLNKRDCDSNACKIEYNLSGNLHRDALRGLESLADVFRYIPLSEFSFKNKIDVSHRQIKKLTCEIQTSRVKENYQMIELEWQNKHDEVKLEIVWMSPKLNTLDVSISKSLDKMEIVYKDGEREIFLNCMKPLIQNNGIVSYEVRLTMLMLMGTGQININDQQMEIFWTAEEGIFSYHDFQFFISIDRTDDGSMNINIEGSTKTSQDELRCPFLSWNTSFTFNQNYENPLLIIDSTQLINRRIFEEKCHDSPITSSLEFSFSGNRNNPFQISLHTELKSEMFPSAVLNLNTISYPRGDSSKGQKYSRPVNGTFFEIRIPLPEETFFKILTDSFSGKYLSISTNIRFFPFTHYRFELLEIDADGEWRNVVDDNVRIARFKLKREDFGLEELLDNEISLIIPVGLVHIEWEWLSNYELKVLRIKGSPGWFLHTPSPELNEQAVLDNPLFILQLHKLPREVRKAWKMFMKV